MERLQITEAYDSSRYIVLFLIVVVVLAIALTYMYKRTDNHTKEIRTIVMQDRAPVDIQPINIQPKDVVREYDYRKSFDPLENPSRRVQRHSIPPYHFKRMIDIPTRGYPDNYSQIGYLKSSVDGENKLIRLFGREEFPGSNRWEYYTSVNAGNDSIKIPIELKKQELYDGDTVSVLDNEYTVTLYSYDAPKYYPDIL